MDICLASRRTAPAVAPFERVRFLPLPVVAPRVADTGALGSGVLMRVLDHLDYGVMLLDEQARLRFANRAALRDCGPGQPVRVADGSLQACDPHEHQDLLRALAAARRGRRSLVALAARQPLLTLAVVPVQEAPGTPAEDAGALVMFARRQACEPLSVEMFARQHRLTSAETGVLRGLAGGRPPAAIAHEAGVALSTVRTQIASIRLKTGACSIAELVRRVTVLPPMVPVVDA